VRFVILAAKHIFNTGLHMGVFIVLLLLIASECIMRMSSVVIRRV
jgi:hypothetical protein